ncbi:S-adenosyl-L-methionine-dependent methyltransferase [Fomitiporia mediterranea MF3/22]|uniref:S-adenosyl-L-methionine-dependent methyltransferase n=1 Tax=Fomitiporia mediterranea (strain MF3/22) TaxID=694068 RepID=UPI00044085AB|nr:S-adenosyl-L-methionine-dependent methyltransferase [Fomitiporia mediterranea MF3/22]EJD06767.1 S-adenosyl-L-methionine-dependent methyltransferase [Fomitiporia mediterranea MF3/22]
MNFYFDAAKVLDKLDAKQGSIKGIISTLPEKDRKRTAALVIETLRYKAVLNDIIHAAELLKHERQKLTSPNLALLLVHDLLFSKGKIQAGDGPIKQAVLRHKTRLQSELTKIKVKRGVKSISDLAHGGDERADLIPRYVRVNTVLWSTEEAIKCFLSHGYVEDGDPLDSKKTVQCDQHIPNLLLFHPLASFNDSPLLSSGKIILQDKASCFPAMILSPPAHTQTRAIDATAAPGNKTTLLSAIMKGRGKLYAFERDKKRFATLKKMVEKAHCGNVEPTNVDFMSVDPHDSKYAGVSHILLDPSCSGSGIVNRLDHLLDTEDEDEIEGGQDERLQKLAAFQLLMIKHAMKFPAVTKIVYSTCSVHAVENEDVVSQALASDEAKEGHFVLASRNEVLPTWPRRGLPARMPGYNSESLVRCVPGEDHTNGFFVSCFVREKDGGNPDFNRKECENSLPNEGLTPQGKRPASQYEDNEEIKVTNTPERQSIEVSADRRKKRRKRSKKQH